MVLDQGSLEIRLVRFLVLIKSVGTAQCAVPTRLLSGTLSFKGLRDSSDGKCPLLVSVVCLALNHWAKIKE